MNQLDKATTALLVIDVQTALMEDAIYQKELFLTSLKKTIEICRRDGIEVIYIQHEEPAGSPFERGTHGWELYSEIAPEAGEEVFRKQVNSAFRNTGLHEYLTSKGICNLILTGLMTEYCFDTTCRVAFELGYNSLIPKEMNSTMDSDELTAEQIHSFLNHLWDQRFGKVISTEELMKLI